VPIRYVALRDSLRPGLISSPSGPLRTSADLMKVSLYLRDKPVSRIHVGRRNDLARLVAVHGQSSIAANRAKAFAEPLEAIRAFASRHSLEVGRVDLPARRIELSGTQQAMETAFRTKHQIHEHSGRRYRVPTRPIRIPSQLRRSLLAVLGLDERPQIVRSPRPSAFAGSGDGILPSNVAKLYGLTTGGTGAGQCIGLIQPAGGYLPTDVAASCASMGIPVPNIKDFPVGTGSNSAGHDDDADKEVALDLQTAIAVAPSARFVLYFTADTDAGLVDAITAAIHDSDNRPSVLVTSWGDAETRWSGAARDAMDAALADAARFRITVVAATGDMLATDGFMDGHAHVDYPASSPYVLACGGTAVSLSADRASVDQEQVWNDRMSGTGGGISDVYSIPDYQTAINLPVSVNDGGRRRGVPDLAAAAAPDPGYRIQFRGNAVTMGGTSAVAPLFAGFLALINERRGSPMGLIHAPLYQSNGLFRPITAGDNRPFGSKLGYDSKGSWSACTGLGAPIGAAIVNALVDYEPV
jgi:kumamolisin